MGSRRGAPPGGQEQAFVADAPALGVQESPVPGVDADDPVPQGESDAFLRIEVLFMQPDLRDGLGPGPELLGQRRAVVGEVLLGAHEQDRAAVVALADGLRRRGPRQPRADDHVTVGLCRHGRSPIHRMARARQIYVKRFCIIALDISMAEAEPQPQRPMVDSALAQRLSACLCRNFVP